MKTILITGGTKGIGRAISMKMAREGYDVVLNYHRDKANAERTREECMAAGGRVLLVRADVAVAADVDALFAAIREHFGALDAVINNAGMNIDVPLLEMTEDQWDQVVDVNMKGVFLVSRGAARWMKAGDRPGHIINIGATTGIAGRKNGINYCASKAGVIVMTKCLAKELGPKIRVNCVIPGITRTEEIEQRFDLKKNEAGEVEKRGIPLGRIGEPSEVADIVYFLLSGPAAYINGQKIIVDGGEYMY